MVEVLKGSPLFRGMAEDDIRGCLACSKAQVTRYEKDALVFCQGDMPESVSVLVAGAVAVCNDSNDGRRSIVATFDQPGELFGEVFAFLNHKAYEHYAQALAPSAVLQIPEQYFYRTCGNACEYHAKLVANMLSIFAQKAYYLNQKLQILSCATLRQKIAKMLLCHCGADGRGTLSMGREALADYLNVARPSLSRELMKMQEDGLVRVGRQGVFIADLGALQQMF